MNRKFQALAGIAMCALTFAACKKDHLPSSEETMAANANGNANFIQPAPTYTLVRRGTDSLYYYDDGRLGKVDTGTLKLDFYDNAEIDGDSITVMVNKQVVLTHQKLSAKPATTYVRIDLRNPFVEVEMVAENLGSIPPNTALLIVTAGNKQYELFLTSTTTKSARVRFIYEKEEPPSAKRL